MPLRLLIALFTINTVVSQLVLRRALNQLGGTADLARFIGKAALSPWIYTSVALQVLSYVIWMLIVSREKLGVATASVGAAFYILVSLSAWLIYGETLSRLQWTGIVLVTLGVVCISLGGEMS